MDAPQRDTAEDLLTTGPAARELNCSESTVRKYDRLGILRAVRTVGNIRLFRRSDVDRLKAQREGGNVA